MAVKKSWWPLLKGLLIIHSLRILAGIHIENQLNLKLLNRRDE